MNELNEENCEKYSRKASKAKIQINKKYKIKYSMKRVKEDLKSSIIYFLIGMLFTIMVVSSTLDKIFEKTGICKITECKNVEIETTYDSDGNIIHKPSFHYEVNGTKYVYTFPYYTSMEYKDMNKNKYIYYDINNPQNCLASCEIELGIEDIIALCAVLIFPITGIYLIKESLGKIKLINEREGNNDEIRNDNF